MVLKYKFKYLSDNNSFITILDNILSKKKTTYNLNKEGEFIFLHIEDEEERVLKISDEISKELPMSIFLQDFTLEVVPHFPILNYQYTPDSFRKSYCSNCLTIVENIESNFFYNPFVNCEICGATCDVKNEIVVYENGNKIDFKEYKELFEKLALYISENKKVKINGLTFSKLDKIENEKENIVCLDTNSLSKIVVGSKQKSALLNSLEKPIMEFNLNAIYQQNNNCSVKKINVRTPWNLFYHLLSNELKKLNIEFIKYTNDDESILELSFKDVDYSPKISITENKIFLLKNINFDKELETFYNKFDLKSKAQFMVLLRENNLFEKSILNLHLSSLNDDVISLYSPKIDGVVDILKFNIPKNISLIYENIKKENNGEKLLENFIKKFPEVYEKSLNFDFSKLKRNSMMSLFEIVSAVLGIENIYENASTALMQKGPSIDFIVDEKDQVFNKEFNVTKLIKSGMSFKLAGLDNKTLSLGYFESYARFLALMVDNVNERFPIDGLSLSGNFIADEFFSKLLSHAITLNTQIYYNKDFPIEY